jgi:hypothetical protein
MIHSVNCDARTRKEPPGNTSLGSEGYRFAQLTKVSVCTFSIFAISSNVQYGSLEPSIMTSVTGFLLITPVYTQLVKNP